jgi:hypothetical protein
MPGGTVEQHIKILGVLNIVWGALGALSGLVILLVFGGAFGVLNAVALHHPEAAFIPPILVLLGGAISIFLLLLSIPSILAGIGLLYFKPWARIMAIIISALHLMNIPFGTALGIYGLWVLFSPKSQSLFTANRTTQTNS